MELGKIRYTITRLCWRLLVGTVDRVSESNQICEFDCRATECDWEKWERCERRLSGHGTVRGPVAASLPPMQAGADGVAGISEEDRKCLSASDVAKKVLRGNSSASISNVLVLGTEGSTPLKRVEIHFADPDEVPDRLNSLASAFERSGVEFRAVWNPAMPATEIWLTSPLHDGRKTLLSCAATVGEQVAQRLAAQTGIPGNQAQKCATHSQVSLAVSRVLHSGGSSIRKNASREYTVEEESKLHDRRLQTDS